MKRVAIYIRVSTQEQAKEGYSIGAQKDKLLAYCKSKDWIPYGIYVDDGYTGTNLQRPALKNLLKDISKINVVLVYKLDRLSRSQKDVLYLIEEKFLVNNIDFVSLMESFDTTSAFGRAMVGILAVFAQLERDTIIERSKMGKERRAKEGKWRGGPVPLGYDYVKGQIRVNEYEASIIREIFQEYINGSGTDSIARMLNKEGYRSKQNAKFTSTKIKTYLKNPIYAGFIPHKEMLFKGEHNPIIDPKTFDLAKSIMEERGDSYRKTSDALLGGLLICGECGAKMFQRHIKGYPYYTCYTYHGSPSHMITAENCNIGYINSSWLEGEVIKQMKLFEEDEITLDKLIEEILKQNQSGIDHSAIIRLKRELEEVNKELKRWYDAYGKGNIEIQELNMRVSLLTEKKQNINHHISKTIESFEKVKTSYLQAGQLKEIIQSFSLIWNKATIKEKKIILKGLIKSITVFKSKNPIIEFQSRR